MRKSLLLLSFFLFTASQLVGQNYSTVADGSWTSSTVWGNVGPGTVDIEKDIKVSHYITHTGDLFFKQNAGMGNTDRLYINSDFVVYGNVNFAKEAIKLEIGPNGRMIVFGNFYANNKVSLSNTGILVVTDNPLTEEQEGQLYVNGGQAEYDATTGITFADGFTGNAVDSENPNTHTTAEMEDYIANNPSLKEVYDFVKSGGTTTLPVEWLYVRTSQDGAELEWATAQEINNDYFVVELSRDAQDWTQIKTVAGAGNTSERQYYSFSLAGYEGYQYARIKQVDYDGKFEYSALVKLKASKASAPGIQSLYPNPAVDQLKLEVSSERATSIRVRVLSVNGNALLQYDFSSVQGMQQYTLDLDGLEKGLYLLSLEDQLTGTTQLKRFHKQ